MFCILMHLHIDVVISPLLHPSNSSLVLHISLNFLWKLILVWYASYSKFFNAYLWLSKFMHTTFLWLFRSTPLMQQRFYPTAQQKIALFLLSLLKSLNLTVAWFTHFKKTAKCSILWNESSENDKFSIFIASAI